MNIPSTELASFENFALDMLKHFNFIPDDFEDSQGNIYGSMECWNAATKLKLIELIKL